MSAIIQRENSISKLNSQLDFILLDGSGSMQPKWWDMLAAIDTYVSTLRTNAVDSHLIMHIFDDSDLRLEGRNTHIRDWKPFDIDPVGAHFGGTPLYDAIVMMGATIRDLNPSACAITIVTDGENGHNNFATLEQATAVLDWLRAQGFQVTFIGCDFNNSRQARALGANDSNSIGVQKKLLSAAAKNYAEKRTAHARTGADISFTEGERQQFGGHLADMRGN
jgi:hypothetical protein